MSIDSVSTSDALAAEVKRLRAENERLRQRNAELRAQNEQMASALRVLHTWASFDLESGHPAALVPSDVVRMTRRVLDGGG